MAQYQQQREPAGRTGRPQAVASTPRRGQRLLESRFTIGPSAELAALCRRWMLEHRAVADDLLARAATRGEPADRAAEALRHARVAKELEQLIGEISANA